MDNQLIFIKQNITCTLLTNDKFSYTLLPNQSVIEGVFLEARLLNYGILMVMKYDNIEKVELRSHIPIEIIKLIIDNLDLQSLLNFRQVYKLMTNFCYDKYLSLKMFDYRKLDKKSINTDIRNIIFYHLRDSSRDSYYRKRIECYPNAQLFGVKITNDETIIISFFEKNDLIDYEILSDEDLFNELNPRFYEENDEELDQSSESSEDSYGFSSLAYTRH